ncbi:molecular chaperone DnaK [bacterium]|nr:molecular chaperone DnaK [bacterium]MCI0602846.1 molecular chaperone DnaK [bacterium]
MAEQRIIGIDLGTTNSCAALYENGVPQVIPNLEGARTTPSIVAFSEKSDRLVGQIAKRQAVVNPINTIFAVKRLIGRKFDSPEIEQVRNFLPYQLNRASNGDIRIKVKDHEYSPEEISSYILQNIKKYSEDYLGYEIYDAIITVPAHFNDSQRQATKDAGQIAGLNVRRIINEPTAAALAYGLNKTDHEIIAVFDLGGGTFDITILEIHDGVFEVLATNGNTFLGGEDFDRRVIRWMLEEFREQAGIDLSSDRMAMQRIKEAAEKAKCELSTTLEAKINLPFITADQHGPKHLDLTLQRSKLEVLIEDLLDQIEKPCYDALKDAGIRPEQLNQVILVGGQTRTPKVIERVNKIFGKSPNREINPDEVVAMGAAVQGAVLNAEVKDIVLLDVTPLPLGIETRGGNFTVIIEKNTTIPTRKSLIFTTVTDNQSTVEINVLQGEGEKAHQNKSLGKFELTGILPAPRGVPQVEVTFDIDANGIVQVSARDSNTGLKQAIVISASSGLSRDEVTRLASNTQVEMKQASVRKEIDEMKNQLDQLLTSNRKVFDQFSKKLDEQELVQLKNVFWEAEQASHAQDAQKMKSSLEAMQRASTLLAQAMLRGDASL